MMLCFMLIGFAIVGMALIRPMPRSASLHRFCRDCPHVAGLLTGWGDRFQHAFLLEARPLKSAAWSSPGRVRAKTLRSSPEDWSVSYDCGYCRPLRSMLWMANCLSDRCRRSAIRLVDAHQSSRTLHEPEPVAATPVFEADAFCVRPARVGASLRWAWSFWLPVPLPTILFPTFHLCAG